MVIVTSKLIANKRFNTSMGLILVCKVDSNIKVIVEGKIIKISAKTGVDDAKKVLIRALPDFNGMKDVDDTANNANTNKIVITGGSKEEVCILPILIVIIDTSGFIVHRYI